MSIRSIIFAAVLVAAAVTIARALINDDLGPLEYVVGVALVLALAAFALRASRRALQRG